MASSVGSVQQPKHWFMQTLDVLSTVQTVETVEFEWFAREINALATIIHTLAIKKFNLSSFRADGIKISDTFNEMLTKPLAERASYLAQSDLFGNLVTTAQPPIEQIHCKHYQETFIGAMFTGFENENKIDLSSLKESIAVSSWTCAAIKTILKPKELCLMYNTFVNMNPTHYQQTLAARMTIGKQLESKFICLAVKELLKQVDITLEETPSAESSLDYLKGFCRGRKTPADNRALAIASLVLQEYLKKIVYTAPLECRQATKENLLVSLKIRARQLS